MKNGDRYLELEALARDLVRLESESPPGNEAAVIEYVADWLGETDINHEIVEKPYEERPQVAAWVGSGAPTVVYNGHADVVPAGDVDRWTHDPYGGHIEDGTLFGRGAADMKTGIAVGMLATRAIRDEIESGRLSGSVVLHVAIGEETADPGTKTLLEEGFDGDYGIVLEPTDFRVATRSKGLACYEITVRGEQSHASRPDQGVNAIEAVGPLIAAVDDYDTRLRENEDPLVGRSYATLTRMEAGTDSNMAVLPEEATLLLDRRVLPEESLEDVDGEIASLLETLAADHDVDATWRRVQEYAAASVPTDVHLASVLRSQVGSVTGTVPESWGIEAATDVRNFVNDAGMEAVTWGPGHLEQAHTVDEHIDLRDAAAGLDILKRTTRELLEST
jgi:succinyl-diaminopimelate desuccinylase